MLEHETDVIIRTVAERTIGARTSVSLGELAAADVPRQVRIYLRRDVEQRLAADLSATPSLSRVDLHRTGMQRVRDSLLGALAEGYVFGREEYLTALGHAVHFSLNYLCRPRWMLRTFVFNDAQFLPAGVIRERLEYFAEYAYLPKLALRLLPSVREEEVHADTFAALITRIDTTVVSEHSRRELAFLARPLFDFVAIAPMAFHDRIPIAPILRFLDDKDLPDLKEHVRLTSQRMGISDLSLDDLAGMLDHVPEAPAPPPPPLPPSPLPMEEPEGVTHFVEEPMPPSIEQEPPEPAPMLFDLPAPDGQSGLAQEPVEAIPAPRPEAGPEPEAWPKVESEPEPEAQTPTAPPPQLADIESLMTPDQRHRYIRKIFGNDVDFFTAIIGNLNDMTSWSQASGYLREVYSINRVDPFHPDAIEFTDLLHRRFAEAGEQRS